MAKTEVPFRIHFVDAEGVKREAVVRASSSDDARKSFMGVKEHAWFHIGKIKVDRSEQRP